MDPSIQRNSSESRKGPEIDKTTYINYVKRVHAFSAFVDMQDGKEPTSVSRAHPARLRHSANSITYADIKWSLLLAIHTIDSDQFEARDLDLSNEALTVSLIKLRLSTMPFIILRLESNAIDSPFAYQELNPVVPKYLTLRDTIKDICDKRVGYWVYHTMLYRVCHVCNSSQRGRGKFDEFKEHMRTLVFRQNEVFPVHPAREWPTYKTVMSNYRNFWDIKQLK
ncbi:hypothetical protein BGZ57DRAFT_953692 [Hyaloscypha finlandica]|nr:hypothetical protein BGZ57DRAFT_953692 [Hyaloscypha finlandica]